MSPALYNSLFILLISLHTGLSQLVRTQQVVTATLGEDAVLICELMKPKDVRQVTWQKETTGVNENVATYSKRGPHVNPPFQRKVEFEDEGLQKCSIVIRGVSRGDESCYKCLFNAYPEGAISGRTCLQINELYGPSLLITQTNNSHTTLSCSATGRPAPTITWDHIENICLDKSTMADVTHPNETVTVTITAMVAASSLPDKDTRVGCVASSVGAVKDVSMVIPTRDQASFAGTVVGAAMGSMCLIAGICVILWFLKRRNDTSSRETPTSSPPTRDTQTFTPSRMTTPISSPFKMLDSLSSSAKRMMQQAQGVVKKISPERPDDLQCRRKLLEGDEN